MVFLQPKPLKSYRVTSAADRTWTRVGFASIQVESGLFLI